MEEEDKKEIIEEEIDISDEEDAPEEKIEKGPFPWLRVILIAAIIVETALLVYTATQRNMEGRELSSARQKLASTEEELTLSKDEIESLTSRIGTAKRNLEMALSEKSKLEIEVQEKDLEKLKIQLQQQELAQSKTDLEKKLRREKQISEYLRRKIVDSKNNELVLIKKVEKLVEAKKQVEEEITTSPGDDTQLAQGLDSVPLKEVVVKSDEEIKPPLSGSIVHTKYDTEFPFIIISLGKTNGVSAGDRFVVMRGKADKKRKKQAGFCFIARERGIHPYMSVADIEMTGRDKKGEPIYPTFKKGWQVVSE